MRINPKTVTTCELERAEIVAGLQLRRVQLEKTLTRKRYALKVERGESRVFKGAARPAVVERLTADIDATEMQAARVADLLVTFAEV